MYETPHLFLVFSRTSPTKKFSVQIHDHCLAESREIIEMREVLSKVYVHHIYRQIN